jgi:hypothetical protein
MRRLSRAASPRLLPTKGFPPMNQEAVCRGAFDLQKAHG